MNIQENIITDYLQGMKLTDILGKYNPTYPTLSNYLIRKILIDNNIQNRGRYSKYKALINNETPERMRTQHTTTPNDDTHTTTPNDDTHTLLPLQSQTNIACFPKSNELILKSKQMRARRAK
jgi:hypothetical protein